MKKFYPLLIVVLTLSTLLSACAPAAAPAPAAPAATPVAAAPAAQATNAPVALAPTAAPAAAQPAAATVKGHVTIWYDSGAAWNDFIAAFGKEMATRYPGIAIEWVTQDTNQLSAKLVSAFATKQGPDIAMGSQYRLVAAEQQFKAWEDLAPRLASDPELKETVAALPKVNIDTYYLGQKLWGLPQVVQTTGLFVRKSWLDKLGAKVPADWEELTNLAVRFTKEDPDGNGKADTFGYCIFGAPGVTNSAGVQFQYLLGAAGTGYPITTADGKPNFNTPEGQKVVKYMAKWMHEVKVLPPDTPTFTHKEFYNVTQAGKCGMGRIGAWNIGSWAKSDIGTDYVVIPMPPMEKGMKAYQANWSNAIVMNASSKDKDATYIVLKALESKWGQTMFYKMLTSAARTDLDWDTLATTPQLKYFTKLQPDYTVELSYIDTWLPTVDILSKHLNAVLADPKLDPVKELAAADAEAQAKFKEIRKQ